MAERKDGAAYQILMVFCKNTPGERLSLSRFIGIWGTGCKAAAGRVTFCAGFLFPGEANTNDV